ncbi:MAG: hypothetical protein IPK81_02075 [Rhodospirillales bacterium]|nr:MAG: hypothetical protein IPK81_02075 [Rhodospirillales bacterium]
MSMRTVVAVATVAGVAGWTLATMQGGHAALPPKYERWGEFGTVVATNEIARALEDPVSRIEWVPGGAYRVVAGRCLVDVHFEYASSASTPPMPGARPARTVVVGKPRCP